MSGLCPPGVRGQRGPTGCAQLLAPSGLIPTQCHQVGPLRPSLRLWEAGPCLEGASAPGGLGVGGAQGPCRRSDSCPTLAPSPGPRLRGASPCRPVGAGQPGGHEPLFQMEQEPGLLVTAAGHAAEGLCVPPCLMPLCAGGTGHGALGWLLLDLGTRLASGSQAGLGVGSLPKVRPAGAAPVLGGGSSVQGPPQSHGGCCVQGPAGPPCSAAAVCPGHRLGREPCAHGHLSFPSSHLCTQGPPGKLPTQAAPGPLGQEEPRGPGSPHPSGSTAVRGWGPGRAPQGEPWSPQCLS